MKISALLAKDYSTYTTGWSMIFRFIRSCCSGKSPIWTPLTRSWPYSAKPISNRNFKKVGAVGYAVVFQTEFLKDVHFSQGKMATCRRAINNAGYVFLFLAVFVLVIALLNYINLLTAQPPGEPRNRHPKSQRGGTTAVDRSVFVGVISVEFAGGRAGNRPAFIIIPFFNDFLQIQLAIAWGDGLLMAGLALLSTALLGDLPGVCPIRL